MSPARSGDQPSDLADVLVSIARDAGHLVTQHAELFRSEIRQGVGGAVPALAAIGAGVGLAAVGGGLGSHMLVHGLHRSTRLPLWACYGLAGGLLATVGVGLIGAGTRRVANLGLVPRETIAALKEDLEWIRDRTTSTS